MQSTAPGTDDVDFFIKQAPAVFTPDELAILIREVQREDADITSGTVVAGKLLPDIRRSRIVWLPPEGFGWVYERLQHLAQTANAKYRYRIDGFQANAQISVYDESEQGFYDWHMDMGPHLLTRKLSISIPLNDDTEYEGGRLEFQTGARVIQPRQQAGTAIIFPGFVLHQVTPVTRGRRYSMVVWIKGPAWC